MFGRLKSNVPIRCFFAAIAMSVLLSAATGVGVLVLIVMAIRWFLNAGV